MTREQIKAEIRLLSLPLHLLPLTPDALIDRLVERGALKVERKKTLGDEIVGTFSGLGPYFDSRKKDEIARQLDGRLKEMRRQTIGECCTYLRSAGADSSISQKILTAVVDGIYLRGAPGIAGASGAKEPSKPADDNNTADPILMSWLRGVVGSISQKILTAVADDLLCGAVGADVGQTTGEP